MDKNKVILRKIPLEIFINVLVDIYDQGVDYVDIVGVPDEVQDTIGVVFEKEYMTEEAQKALEEMEEEEAPKNNIEINLSDDNDLNQLI